MSGSLHFEWDDKKNKINIKKHGVDFNDAILVFNDEYRLEDLDEEHSDYEERWQIIGMVDNVLFVIYTEREDVKRIISARHAEKAEEDRYYVNRARLFIERCKTD